MDGPPGIQWVIGPVTDGFPSHGVHSLGWLGAAVVVPNMQPQSHLSSAAQLAISQGFGGTPRALHTLYEAPQNSVVTRSFN